MSTEEDLRFYAWLIAEGQKEGAPAASDMHDRLTAIDTAAWLLNAETCQANPPLASLGFSAMIFFKLLNRAWEDGYKAGKADFREK